MAEHEESARTHAGGRLVAHMATILRSWEERVRREIRAAGRQSTPVLIDTLPGFLEALAQALAPGHPRATAAQGSGIPAEHGGERARLTEYGPGDVIREYQLLRDAIFEVLEAEAPLTESERRIVVVSIDEALSTSCTAYFLVQQRIREQFVATLTHDLRSPLTAAKASAALIARRADQPEILKWAARVIDSVDRADQMIRDLLDATSLRAGERPQLALAECDLVSVARESVAHLQAAHGDHFVLVTPPALKGYWSAEALRRAIENLGSNAVKYGSSDRAITLTVREISGRVIISVHNFGSYLPPEERELLFQPFRRMTQARTSGQRGSPWCAAWRSRTVAASAWTACRSAAPPSSSTSRWTRGRSRTRRSPGEATAPVALK